MNDMKRRNILKSMLIGGGLAAMPSMAHALSFDAAIDAAINPSLLARAKGALAQHGDKIKFKSRIAIADYSRHSASPRFYIINLITGEADKFLVSHGKGSDVRHSGWLKDFSNISGSEASSSGAYLTGEFYTGKHGHSQRLDGLDPCNDNARSRAIVMHSAWYVDRSIAKTSGKIGRSQGCFAFAETDLKTIFDKLGPGIYYMRPNDFNPRILL